MDTKAFTFNSNAKYNAGSIYNTKDLRDMLTSPSIQVKTSSTSGFLTKYPDPFEKYPLTVTSATVITDWHTQPMRFWQNQVNFAVWCATAGCGISKQDHLEVSDPMMRAVYHFHVYYQIRRILAELQAPLPQDQAWDALNNPYDQRAYERICGEFGVSPQTDWRVKGKNHGLGRVYNYWTNDGYHIYGDGTYYEKSMTFAGTQTSPGALHIDYIKQDSDDANHMWGTFVLDVSQGFTQSGVERINDSIRTYVWDILGAQAQTRSQILGIGTAFDAQKQFLANLEDTISSPVDLPSAIKRYQDVLQYAGSEVNFVFGIGLYMAPSDMLLRVGRVAGYNNEITIATSAQDLGINTNVNKVPTPPEAVTGETGLVVPQGPKPPIRKTMAQGALYATSRETGVSAQLHSEEKTALVVGSVGVGLFLLWVFSP